MESYDIYWRGVLVGALVEATPDMWFLEGEWRPGEVHETDEFRVSASRLDAKEVMKDPAVGIRVQLRDPGVASDDPQDALVLSLAGTRLFVRRVFDAQAVAWLRANVPG